MTVSHQAVSRDTDEHWTTVITTQYVVIKPVTRHKAAATDTHARKRQFRAQVPKGPHPFLVIKRKVTMQQMLLEIIRPVELTPLVRALVAAEGAREPALLLVCAYVARQVASKVFAADLALILFFHGRVTISVISASSRLRNRYGRNWPRCCYG